MHVRLLYKSFCPASRRDSLRTRNCAAPALMRVSLQALSCCTWTCLSTKACAALMRVRLLELLCCTWTCLSTRAVLHLCVCVYTSFCAAPGRVYLQESVLSVYKSFVLHLDLSVYKSLCCTCVWLSTRELCAAPGRVCQQELSPCCT